MDNYILAIAALLPLTALMVILQVNPYQALIMRGILGAVAALNYCVLGAADVAITEALVGTLLAITLYAIAIRSSFVLRLGILKEDLTVADDISHPLGKITQELRQIFRKRYLRLEILPYSDRESLEQALEEKYLHAICTYTTNPIKSYQAIARLPYLYEIMKAELTSATTSLNHFHLATTGEKH